MARPAPASSAKASPIPASLVNDRKTAIRGPFYGVSSIVRFGRDAVLSSREMPYFEQLNF
jgi:hypothetical protein